PRSGASPARSDYVVADNLFNPFSALRDAEIWLHTLPKTTFDEVAMALKALLGLGHNDRLLRQRGSVFVRIGRGTYTLEALSEGYRSVLGMAADIMNVMLKRWKQLESAEGVVLIDELETHLHPTWAMQIVSRLRAAFPRVQFIATSH